MDIKQHKQFLLSEIKVNNPNKLDLVKNNGDYDYVDTDLVKNILTKKYPDEEENIDLYCEEIDDTSGYEDANLNDLYKDFEIYINNNNLDEDVSNFKVGQTKQSDGHKSTVTDVNPTTNSVTWTIKKDITDKEIWEDLTKVIQKFETIQVKDFHSRPKLIQLIKDLKTIRNKFSRTIQK